jgi:hypothetical protein
MPGISNQRQGMRGDAENNLDNDLANVQSCPDRECASEIDCSMAVSQSAMVMVMILIMSSMIVVTHCAILLGMPFWRCA